MKAFICLFKKSNVLSVFFLIGFQWAFGQTSAEVDGIYYDPGVDVHPDAAAKEDLYEGQYGQGKSGEYAPRVGGRYFDSLGDGPQARLPKKLDQDKTNNSRLGLSYDFDYRNSWGPSKGVDISYNVIGFYPYWGWGYPYWAGYYPYNWAWGYGWWGGPFGHYWGSSLSFGWSLSIGWPYPYWAWGYGWWGGPFGHYWGSSLSFGWSLSIGWPYPYWAWDYGWGYYPWRDYIWRDSRWRDGRHDRRESRSVKYDNPSLSRDNQHGDPYRPRKIIFFENGQEHRPASGYRDHSVYPPKGYYEGFTSDVNKRNHVNNSRPPIYREAK